MASCQDTAESDYAIGLPVTWSQGKAFSGEFMATR